MILKPESSDIEGFFRIFPPKSLIDDSGIRVQWHYYWNMPACSLMFNDSFLSVAEGKSMISRANFANLLYLDDDILSNQMNWSSLTEIILASYVLKSAIFDIPNTDMHFFLLFFEVLFINYDEFVGLCFPGFKKQIRIPLPG